MGKGSHEEQAEALAKREQELQDQMAASIAERAAQQIEEEGSS